jgi:hypothetical protein
MTKTFVAGLLALTVALAAPVPGPVAGAVADVAFIPGAETTAAFTKGKPLVETDAYKATPAAATRPARRKSTPATPTSSTRSTGRPRS